MSKLGLGQIWIFGRIPDNPEDEIPDPEIRLDVAGYQKSRYQI